MASTTAVPTSDLPVPYLYSSRKDDKGRTYYTNHATQTTSWLHPVKLQQLQEAGLVAPGASSAPFVGDLDDAAVPVPAPWERRMDPETGLVRYVNGETGEEDRIHPEGVARGLAGREGAAAARAAAAATTALPAEEEFTSEGQLPPWVVEEVAVPPGGRGEPEPYWVDYRTGTQNPAQSPLDIYEARQRLKLKREREEREGGGGK